MAIFRIEYTNFTGSSGWNIGDIVYYNNLGATGYALTGQVAGTIPSAGIILISGTTTPVPTTSIYPVTLLNSATIAAYSTLTEQQQIAMHNSGAKFNIRVQSNVLIGAYWGVKVTVQ